MFLRRGRHWHQIHATTKADELGQPPTCLCEAQNAYFRVLSVAVSSSKENSKAVKYLESFSTIWEGLQDGRKSRKEVVVRSWVGKANVFDGTVLMAKSTPFSSFLVTL